MAITLHRCKNRLRTGPCWRVQKALDEMGVDYVVERGPVRPSKRNELMQMSGQRLYPVIEFEDGSVYRDESKDMERRIRDGRLGTTAQTVLS